MGHRVSRQVTLFGQASWHGRRYRTRTHLDGPVWDASLRGNWVITPTVRAALSGGYARERPRLRRERNRSRWLGAGVDVILPLGFTVGGSAEYRWTDYESGWFPFVRKQSPRVRDWPATYIRMLQCRPLLCCCLSSLRSAR